MVNMVSIVGYVSHSNPTQSHEITLFRLSHISDYHILGYNYPFKYTISPLISYLWLLPSCNQTRLA